MSTYRAALPDVDIVIPTYGRAKKLGATISSILANSYTNFVLWVVDQGGEPATRELVQRQALEDPRVRYVCLPRDGSGPKRNGGALLGQAPYILYTNDDCLVNGDWIEKLLAELQDPDTWMVFGQVLPGPRELKPGEDPDSKVVLALNTWDRREVYFKNPYNLRFGQGHNMGVRRDRFLETGGFDEYLGAGGILGAWEDRDIGYRMLVRKGRIVYTPAAVIQHCHWLDWNSVERAYKSYGIGTGSSVLKYMRCGDFGALLILLEWMLSQGLRQALSGLFKTHRVQKFRIGMMQLIYPLQGFLIAARYPIDREHCTYRGLATAQDYTPVVRFPEVEAR